jgi:POT family
MAKIVPAYVRSHLLITPYCFFSGQCYTSVFGIIFITFLGSFVVFLCGIPFYKKETPTRDSTMFKTLHCVYYGVSEKIKGRSSKSQWIDVAEEKYPKEFVDDVKKFLKIVKLFLPLPIFYALLAQQDSTWTFQASLMDTKMFGIEIEADQFKAIGPVLLLVLIPLYQKIVEPILNYFNVHLNSLEYIFIGGLFASLSFVYAGFLQYFIFTNLTFKYSILWQFPQFLLIMIAEMLISVPGLRFAYTNGPSSMKSILTAIFFINNALGNLLVVVITQLHIFNYKSYEFFFYAFLMLIAAIIIMLNAYTYSDEDPVTEESSIEAFIFAEEANSTNLEENCNVLR